MPNKRVAAKAEPKPPPAEVEPKCDLCDRAMLAMDPQLCGACRAKLTDEERAELMPATRGYGDAFAVALVRDQGAVRLVELRLDAETIKACAHREHEREYLQMVLPQMTALAEAWSNGEKDT